jgi:hypothetical protein
MTPARREELICEHERLWAADEPDYDQIAFLEMALVADPDAPHYCFDTEACIVCSEEVR